jgi:Outer membrane protein beta-barrel domain
MFRPSFLLVTLFSCHALAQQVGFGVKGGVRATNDIEGSFGTSSESSRYLVGPMVEATLPHGFSVEADALYSRPGYSSIFANAFGSSTVRARGTSWEFPLLIKRGLPFPLIHPYVELGYAPRRQWINVSVRATHVSYVEPTSGPASVRRPRIACADSCRAGRPTDIPSPALSGGGRIR